MDLSILSQDAIFSEPLNLRIKFGGGGGPSIITGCSYFGCRLISWLIPLFLNWLPCWIIEDRSPDGKRIEVALHTAIKDMLRVCPLEFFTIDGKSIRDQYLDSISGNAPKSAWFPEPDPYLFEFPNPQKQMSCNLNEAKFYSSIKFCAALI